MSDLKTDVIGVFSDVKSSCPTGRLRFSKAGRLQQEFNVTTWRGGNPATVEQEWQDVPFEAEAAV